MNLTTDEKELPDTSPESFDIVDVKEIVWTQSGNFLLVLECKNKDGKQVATRIRLDMLAKALDLKGI